MSFLSIEKAALIVGSDFSMPLILNDGNVAPPRANFLLAALPDEDYARLLPNLTPIKLARGEILYDSGDRINHLYFPAHSIVSLFYTLENGTTAEMAMVGSFGVVGYSVFLGGVSAAHQAVVQIAGEAYQIKARVLEEEFARSGALQKLLLRYTQTLITQISQISVCNRLHTFEQRLCRWLLLCHDRVQSDEIVLTQEMISHLLGVMPSRVASTSLTTKIVRLWFLIIEFTISVFFGNSFGFLR